MSRNNGGLTTTQRGYGWDHALRRRQALASLPEWSTCARCSAPLWKFAKDRLGRSALHFDHTDDRGTYLGFSHAKCNTTAGAVKAGAVKRAQRVAKQWHSRAW